jgi:hypothetical protein
LARKQITLDSNLICFALGPAEREREREWRKSGLDQSKFYKPSGITVAKFVYWVEKENFNGWAANRFERALENDRVRTQIALSMIQKLYATERKATKQKLDAEAVKELRLNETLPIINELGKWIFEQIKSTLPKSRIGKAMQYSYARWDALSAYLYDRILLIDNNQVETLFAPRQ